MVHIRTFKPLDKYSMRAYCPKCKRMIEVWEIRQVDKHHLKGKCRICKIEIKFKH